MENVAVSCSCMWAEGIAPYHLPASQHSPSGGRRYLVSVPMNLERTRARWMNRWNKNKRQSQAARMVPREFLPFIDRFASVILLDVISVLCFRVCIN